MRFRIELDVHLVVVFVTLFVTGTWPTLIEGKAEKDRSSPTPMYMIRLFSFKNTAPLVMRVYR